MAFPVANRPRITHYHGVVDLTDDGTVNLTDEALNGTNVMKRVSSSASLPATVLDSDSDDDVFVELDHPEAHVPLHHCMGPGRSLLNNGKGGKTKPLLPLRQCISCSERYTLDRYYWPLLTTGLKAELWQKIERPAPKTNQDHDVSGTQILPPPNQDAAIDAAVPKVLPGFLS